VTKRYLSIFCLLTLLSANGQINELKLVFDASHEIPNTSIRAIETDGESGLWFAGSNGKFGRIIQGTLFLDSIAYEGKKPSFRALAANDTQVYALSIENPALLFRLANPGGTEEAELIYREEHNGVFYDSMTFLNKRDGIAMGDPIGECLSILITHDGGNSWSKTPCSQLPKTFEGEAGFAASDTNIATFGDHIWVATGGSRARVLHSADKGERWEVFDTPITQGKSMTGIYSLDFSSAQVGIIMGGNWENKGDTSKTKALSQDGGKTWNLVSEGMLPGYISCVQYVPGTGGQEVMAVSTEGIYHSTDQGRNWKKLSDQGFYSLRFENDKSAWMSRQNEIVHVKLLRQKSE